MMGARLIPLFLVLLLTAPPGAHAQDSSPEADSGRVARATVIKAATYTSAYYAVSLFVLGQTWYKDRAVVPFHSAPVNRGWRDDRIPGWLNIAVGYGAKGMYGEFENPSVYDGAPLPEAVRYRQFLLSLDIDWAAIKTDHGLLRLVLQGMTFIKAPFPAIEYNSMER